jgi:hypothetical protein
MGGRSYYDGSGCQEEIIAGSMETGGPALHLDYTVKKKMIVFPVPAGMSLTKLSLAGNNLIIPGQGEFG